MVFARVSTWHFKKGKREAAFLEIDRVLNSASHRGEGFRGYLSLMSHEDSNTAVVITLWQDQEALDRTEAGNIREATGAVQDSIQTPPQVEHFRVFSTELYQRSA